MRKAEPAFKFKYELILAFCTTLIISLFFVVFIHSRQISKTTEGQFVQFMQQVTDQLNKNIENSIKDIDRIQFFYIYDIDLLKIMKKKKPSGTEEYVAFVKDNRKMTQYFINSITMNEDIVNIFVRTEKGNEYAHPNIGESNINPGTKARLEAFIADNPGQLFVFPTGHYRYVSSVRDVITIGRACIDPNTNRQIGYSLVNISYRIFEKLFENLDSDARMRVFVHNGEKILYHSQKNDIEKEDFEEVIQKTYQKNDTMRAKIGKSKYLLVSNHSDYTGLTVVEYVPRALVNQSVMRNTTLYWQLTVAIMLLAVVISVKIASRISRPILHLEKAMADVKDNKNLKMIKNRATTQEVWSLTESYNTMVTAAKDWLRKEKQYQSNQKKLALMTLELQVNPHFLYNTLNLISARAYMNEQPEILEITEHLGELLRFNLKANQIVTLREELEQVEKYIKIQKLSRSRNIVFLTEIEPRLYRQQILKSTLQPLVENAILHGLRDREEDALLKITASVIEGDVIIGITDNGTGMDEAQVESITEKLGQSIDSFLLEAHKDHIGVRNVHFRIVDHYGKEYGLTIESYSNIGTTVSVKLPLQFKKGEEEYDKSSHCR
ncbi:MAG: histidine kinase [Firmicutes bacterium]|nr:histidine kinase [Bacillota bacterium]